MKTAVQKTIFVFLLCLLSLFCFATGVLSQTIVERNEDLAHAEEVEGLWTYEYTGSSTAVQFVVPISGLYSLKCWGAQGGSVTIGDKTATGGKGGYVQATGFFTAGTVLYVHVGGAGDSSGAIGGGGAADPNCVQHTEYRNLLSGGGSTDIRLNSDDLSARIIVGGGGGGGGVSHDLESFVDGGAGGGTNGFVGSAGDSAGRGVGGSGGALNSGTLFYGESTDKRDDSITWDCWCTPHNRDKGISTISGGLFGAGGGGYYGGGAGTANCNDPYTNYTPDGEEQEVTYDFAAAGGGGSSYISGFKRNNRTVCVAALGYTFLENSGETDGEAHGGEQEGAGKAEISYEGIAEEYKPSEKTELVRIDKGKGGWYYLSANGAPSGETNGTYLHGYVLLNEGDYLLIRTGYGENGLTTIWVSDPKTMLPASPTESDIDTLTEGGYMILQAGSADDPTNNFVAGEPSAVGNPKSCGYVILRAEKEENTASPVRGGVELKKASDEEMPNTYQFLTETEEESPFTISESGQYRIRVWGGCNPDSEDYASGKGAYIEGTVWLIAGRDTLSVEMLNEIVIKDVEVEDEENGGTYVEQREVGGITRTAITLHRKDRKDEEQIADYVLLIADYKTGANDESSVNDEMLEDSVLNKQVNTAKFACVTLERIRTDEVGPSDLTNTPARVPTEYGDARYFYDAIPITLTASDDGCGVEYIEYTTGSYSDLTSGFATEVTYDPETGVTVTIEPPADEELDESGIQTVVLYWRAFDRLGNVSSNAWYQFFFDRNINTVYFHTGTGGNAVNTETEEEVVGIDYNVESAEIDVSVVEPAAVTGLTFDGWYTLDGTSFRTDLEIETVYPRDRTRRQDLHLYARYTLAKPIVASEEQTQAVIYNVGDGVTVPGFTESHVLSETDIGTLSYQYAWIRKVGESWSLPINGQNARDLTYSWGSSGISSKGTYTYKELIAAKITLRYTESAQLEYTSAEEESGEYVLTVEKKSLEHADIVISGTNIAKTYTTAALTQNITVTDRGKTIPGEYTIRYENNVNAGNASVTIAAAEDGNYTGSVTDTFVISAKDLTDVQMGTPDAVVYNGTQYTPTPEVYWYYAGDRVVLTAGGAGGENGDFYYEYAENTTVFDGGYVTAVGRNNYTGRKTVYFRINAAQGVIDVSGVTKTYTYTGDPIIVDSGATIDSLEQTVTASCYSNNVFTTVAEGNGRTITITVPATNNYLSATASFTITVLKAESYVNVENVRKTFDYQYDEDGNSVEQTVDEEGNAFTTNEQTVLYDVETFADVPLEEDEVGFYFTERAYVEESDNYLAAETTFRVYVRKASYVYEIATDEDGYVARFTYNGEGHEFHVEDLIVVPIAQGAEITYVGGALTETVTHVPNADCEYVLRIVISETRNFALNDAITAIVRVDPATAEIVTRNMMLLYTYDGTDHTVDSGAGWVLRKAADESNLVVTYLNNTFRYVSDSGNMIVRLTNKDGFFDYVEKDYEVYVNVGKATPVIDGDLTEGKLQTQAYYGQTLAQASALPVRGDGIYAFDRDGTTELGTVANPVTDITATFTPNDTDNYVVVESIPVRVIVLRAARTLTWAEESRAYTYDGGRHYFRDRGATVNDPNDGKTLFTYEPAYFTTVGEGYYDVTVTVTSDNYNEVSETFRVTVEKAKETIDVSRITTFTYDGEPHSVTTGAILLNPEQNTEEVHLQYEGNAFTTVAEAESEASKVRIWAAETANYKATEIYYQPIMYRAEPTIRFLRSKVFTYTGREQTVGGAADDVELNNTEQTPVFENNTFTTVPEGNALVVRISVEQTANYAAGYLDFRITVHKADPDWWQAQTVHVPYGRTLSFGTGLETGYSFIDPNLAVGTCAQPVSSTQDVFARYTPDDTDNYNILLTIPLTVIVDKADPGLNVLGVQREYVYTGEPITVESGATINNEEQLSLLRYGNNTFTTVPEGNNREVIVSVEESDNYLGASRSVIISMRRAEQQVDLSGIRTSYVYTGAEQRVDGAVLLKGYGEITYSRNTFTTVEEGNAIGSVVVHVAASENYTAYTREVFFTVEKATQEIDTTVAESGYVYTGERQVVTATVEDAEQTVLYENNTFITVAEGDGMFVRFFVNETANYNANEKRVRISVAKRDPQTTEQAVNAFYGQILYDVESELDEGYSFEQLLNTTVGTPSAPTPVSVRFTPRDTANENVLEGLECVLTVLPRPVTLTIGNVTTVYGEEGYADGALTYEMVGTVLDGDDLHVSLQREEGNLPGEYAITANTDNELYDVTVEEGVYEIKKRPLVLDFETKGSYYGEEVIRPEYYIAEGSLYGDDTLSGELDFAVRPTVAFTYEVLCDVTNDRYDISLQTTGYVVMPRPITVYAVVATSVYGAEEAFEYSVEKTEGYDLTGEAILPGDELGGRLYLEGRDVGRQTIASGLFNANYEITFVPAFCTVTPAPITVTANPATSVYGDSVTFDYTVTEGTLLPGDDLRGSLTQEDPEAGEHDISATFANGNYDVTFITAKHTVTPRPVTIKLGNQTMTRSEYMRDSTLDTEMFTVTKGSIIGNDDLMLTLTKEAGSDTGTYFLDATSDNPNYTVEVVKGLFTITKDRAVIEVNPASQTVVYNGERRMVVATVTSGARPEYYYKGADTDGALIVPGSYLIRITAPETNNYYAPDPVEVTLTILQAEIKNERSGVSVVSTTGGFKAGEKLVVNSDVAWDEEKNGSLPESYSVTAAYEIKKADAKNVESDIEGMVSVTIALPKRYASNQTVEVALVSNGRVSVETVKVDENGEITVSGLNLTQIAVIEKQKTPTLAILLIIAAAAVLFLFIGIMVNAGIHKR